MMNNKLQLFNVFFLIVATIVATKLILKTLLIKSSKRLPPVVKGRIPLIGGVARFVANPVEMLKEEYESLGSVFTINAVYKNITFLLEPDVSAYFFKAGESELSQKEVYGFTVPIFGPGIVYDAEYSVRKEQFHFFEESFRIDKLRGFVDYMSQEVQDYFSKWGDNGEVDLKQEMENLIILIASRCFLGQEVRESLSEDIAALINEINVAMGPLTTMFPHLPTPPHWRRDKARKKLDDIFSNVISSRRLSPKSEDDMLQSLINSKYKDGRATTVTEVTGMLITALYGGQRSGSATATWTGAYLVHYKAIWFDAVEEQRRLMKKHGDAITYDAISDMHHLYRCIKEALRLHPPLAMLLRKSHKDFSVTTRKGDKYDIPKGHIIAASPVLSNRVPHIYTNPDSYDPERFCPGREEDRLAGPFSFVSFGGGKHTCLGETFAYLEIKTIWSYLIRNFEIELITPFPETEYNEIVWSPKGKVMVRYKRRKLVIE
ncbi:obtusifoliol 14-alpha demethylase-like [Chenopodium quinoa]|uniref:obtusifoliol 14-alpha demethylase-like n=1 Tax=Chenopodium quinoa TaxID=63459 RepID=UPI000B796DFF|nr:obtusifoliol 14-alpha demethylase-like [Chenopodium quinoa]